MTLSLDTAYRSFGGEVEASSTPTICRLPDSRRHQLWAIALDEGVERQFGSDPGFSHPDLLQRSFGFRLLAFRQLGEHVRGLVHPATLLARFRPDLTGSLPERDFGELIVEEY